MEELIFFIAEIILSLMSVLFGVGLILLAIPNHKTDDWGLFMIKLVMDCVIIILGIAFVVLPFMLVLG